MSDEITEQIKELQEKEQLDEKLKAVYGIVTTFSDIFDTAVQEKLGTVFVSDKYEDLHTAQAMLGEIIGKPGYTKRIITNETVRNELRDAYQAVTLILENTVPDEEEFTKALSILLECYYMILNFVTYDDQNVSAKEALDGVFTVCDQGIEIISALEASEIPDAAYMNPANETFAKRKGQLLAVFEKLRPKFEGEAEKEESE